MRHTTFKKFPKSWLYCLNVHITPMHKSLVFSNILKKQREKKKKREREQRIFTNPTPYKIEKLRKPILNFLFFEEFVSKIKGENKKNCIYTLKIESLPILC